MRIAHMTACVAAFTLAMAGFAPRAGAAAVVGSDPGWVRPSDLVPPLAGSARDWHRHWEMESRIGQSQLILIVRVSNVSALTVVRGAKVETTYREYRFQPIRRLKGVFSRDELAMTSADIGLAESDGSQPPLIQQGELRLLLLTRTAAGGFSCTGASPTAGQDLMQIVPRLSGLEDPIVSMAETLIRVTESGSRKERAELLVAELERASPASSVPLLSALGRRAVWAADMPKAAAPLVRWVQSDDPAVRSVAVQTLERVLEFGSLRDDSKALQECAQALEGLLGSESVETATRVSALRALGHLEEFGRRNPSTAKLLVRYLESPRAHAERVAAATALADLQETGAADRVLAALERLPLDEPIGREQEIIAAAVRLAPKQAAALLQSRLEKKLPAGHAGLVEIAHLGSLRHADAMPTLLDAAHRSLWSRHGTEAGVTTSDVPGLAGFSGWDAFHQRPIALMYAFEQLKDPSAVAVLKEWLRDPNSTIRNRALSALAAIDSDDAVTAVRLRLKAEPDLRIKLHMAAMLGRHGIRDGYPFAIEHVADPGLTDVAAESLAAIGEPRARDELRHILETSHDRRWNAAALTALVALRDPEIPARVQAILLDARDPLLVDAAQAAGNLGDPTLLPHLVPLVNSRSQQIVAAALQGMRPLLVAAAADPAQNDQTRPVVDAVLVLLADPNADQSLRLAAFETVRQVDEPRVRAAFVTIADQPELENSSLLARVELELRREHK